MFLMEPLHQNPLRVAIECREPLGGNRTATEISRLDRFLEYGQSFECELELTYCATKEKWDSTLKMGLTEFFIFCLLLLSRRFSQRGVDRLTWLADWPLQGEVELVYCHPIGWSSSSGLRRTQTHKNFKITVKQDAIFLAKNIKNNKSISYGYPMQHIRFLCVVVRDVS